MANIHKYARHLRSGESPVDFREKLPAPASIRERLAIQLRVKEGVNLDQFDLESETRQTIEQLKNQGLLSQECRQLQLTEQGMLYYDTVAAELI